MDPTLRAFWEVRDELSYIDGILRRGDRAVPPIKLRQVVVQHAHEGHSGIVRTKQNIKNMFWWPGMDVFIERIVRNCITCANSDKSLRTLKPKMGDHIIPDNPWHTIAMDIIEPKPKYILAAIDTFSRWPVIKIVEKVDTNIVLVFLDETFTEEGLPVHLITDNGVQFVSNKAKEYFRRVGIIHCSTSLYNPSGNGVIERFNKVLKNSIQTAGLNNDKWELEIYKMVWMYRTTSNDMTGHSPFEIMRGRLPRTKSNTAWLASSTSSNLNLELVKERIAKTHTVNKEYFDNKKSSKRNPCVEVGMLVS